MYISISHDMTDNIQYESKLSRSAWIMSSPSWTIFCSFSNTTDIISTIHRDISIPKTKQKKEKAHKMTHLSCKCRIMWNIDVMYEHEAAIQSSIDKQTKGRDAVYWIIINTNSSKHSLLYINIIIYDMYKQIQHTRHNAPGYNVAHSDTARYRHKRNTFWDGL